MRKTLFLLLLSLAIPAGARTWNAKTDWHATGNGTTNDAPAIQAGASAIAGGDTVYFPTGTYKINSVVNFSAAATITCQAGAVLQGPNTGTDIFTITSNTTVGGSPSTGCIFDGGGIQAYGTGGDGGQTLAQAITNLAFEYNTFRNMTVNANVNPRTNGGIFLGGGSNGVVIRYNTFSNIMPYADGYNSAGSTQAAQYDPDGDFPRSAIWFYGATNLDIDHNTFSHDYQDIKACQGQQFQAQNILIHHNYSDSHHRMFFEIQSGYACGNQTYNAGIANFQAYDNYSTNSGGPHPYNGTFGFSLPMPTAGTAIIPMSNVAVYQNVIKGVALTVSGFAGPGIGLEMGAENMNVYNNTIMGQWAASAVGFGGTQGGYIQNNYGCMITPSFFGNNGFFGDEGNGATTVTYRGNVASGVCPSGLPSLAVSLGTVTDTSGVLSATATVTTVEYGMQGVVFSIDGNYASAVTGAGPYVLNYGAAGLSTGTHTIIATVVDAVGVPAVSGSQTVSTTHGTGPTGPQTPNNPPSATVWDIAGNAADPINGAAPVTLSSVALTTTGGATSLAAGNTNQLTATCLYSDGSKTTCNNTDSHGNAVSSWVSSSLSSATINSSGLVDAVAVGTTNLTATAGGITSPALPLTIISPPLTLVSITLSTASGSSSIATGTNTQLIATCHYSDGSTTICNTVDAHGNSVTSWSSSATTVATVNSGGLITGAGAGSTTVIASADGVSSSPTLVLAVTAAPPTLVSASLGNPGSATTMSVGGTLQFAAYCQYSDGTTTNCSVADIHGNKVTTWSTGNAASVTIAPVGASQPGLVTAVAQGSAQIQAVIGTVYSSPWTLTINNPPLSLGAISLATTAGVPSLAIGGTNQIVATCVYSDFSTTNCNTPDLHGNAVTSWVTSNHAVMTISSSGLLTAVSPGTANVQAAGDGVTSTLLPLTITALPAGKYSITISGPVTVSGTVTIQ